MNIKQSIQSVSSTILLTLLLVGCSDDYTVPPAGTSGSGAPSSIISNRLVQRVENSGSSGANVSVVERGSSVEYSFLSSTDIRGAGLNVLPTTSWSYTTLGSTATIELEYTNGKSIEVLNFTSPFGGTYRSDSYLNTGDSGWHTGRFTISNVSSGSSGSSGSGSSGSDGGSGGNGSSTAGTAPQACNSQITIYTTAQSGGPISVYWDNANVGTLSQYYTEGSPICGSPTDSSLITLPRTSGHTLFAENDEGTWGPGTIVPRCGCLLYELQ